jgi:uncharacterized membrane protein (UPF0127 family)
VSVREAVLSVAGEPGRVVCRRCHVADNSLERMKGLLGRGGLEADEGLLLRPASSVHTWFMRFPIDIVFLDRELVVLDTRAAVGPWKMARARGAKSVLELPAGACERADIRAGLALALADEPK